MCVRQSESSVKKYTYASRARILVLVEIDGVGFRQIFRRQNQIIQPVNEQIISQQSHKSSHNKWNKQMHVKGIARAIEFPVQTILS